MSFCIQVTGLYMMLVTCTSSRYPRTAHKNAGSRFNIGQLIGHTFMRSFGKDAVRVRPSLLTWCGNGAALRHRVAANWAVASVASSDYRPRYWVTRSLSRSFGTWRSTAATPDWRRSVTKRDQSNEMTILFARLSKNNCFGARKVNKKLNGSFWRF